MTNTLTVRHYARPKGAMREIEMSNIFPEDIEFFTKNDIQISLEEMVNHEIVAYACPRADYSEESEVMTFVKGRSCEDTMRELRIIMCESEFL